MFTIKQGDTKAALKATLKINDKPVDLSDVQDVTFILNEFSLKPTIINRSANILDAPNGVVWFVFESNETSKAGYYKGEFVVTFNDGRTATFPNEKYIGIEIVPNLKG